MAMLAAALVAFFLSGAGSVEAQPAIATSVFEDAWTPARGSMRLGMHVGSMNASEWFSAGERRGIGERFTVPELGAAQFPVLRPLEESIRQLTGLPSLSLSLGQTRMDASLSVLTIPLSAEVGVFDRLSVGVMLPWVRSRSAFVLRANPEGVGGTVGVNPAMANSGALIANAELIAQLNAAAGALRNRLDECAASPGTAGCAALEANRAAAEALISETTTFGTAAHSLYAGSSPAPFVPLAGSAGQTAIENRLAAFNSSYRSMLALDAGDADPISGSLRPAQLPLTAAALLELLADPAMRSDAFTLEGAERFGFGDIELSAKLRVLDTFGAARADGTVDVRDGVAIRSAVAGVVRLGTSPAPLPTDPFANATGDGQHDLEVRSATDIMFGARAWTSLVARYTLQLGDQRSVVIPRFAGDILPPAWTYQQVERKLGNIVQLEVSPRYALSQYLIAGARYRFSSRGSDSYRGTHTIPDAVTGSGDVELDASLLDAAARVEHQVAASFSFSTVSLARAGGARWPVELTYVHLRSVAGSGRMPEWVGDQIGVKIYTERWRR